MANEKETIEAARSLYIARKRVTYIARSLGITRNTIYRWARQYGWDNLKTEGSPLEVGKRRLAALLAMEGKTERQLAEIELLTGVIERLDKLEHRAEKSKPDGGKREKGKPKKKASNDFTGMDRESLLKKFYASQFPYQIAQYKYINNRIRNLLKSRQIGFTRYFSAEALVDAILNGGNQIFLSASKNQASVFRDYIKGFALDWFDQDLTGRDRIDIHTDAGLTSLLFLSTNSCTAQSYNGNLYFDEYFWTRDFEKLDKVSKAMASQKRFRRTYFSTPSAISHPGYAIWSGEPYKERFRKRNQPVPEFPTDMQLRNGILCPDKQYRQIITIDDAIKQGCDLFDLEDLELEYSEDELEQLFRCRFIDDSNSLFQLATLQPCISDCADWRDFNPGRSRPYLNKPVWIGYDPSRTRDGACIAVVAPPKRQGGQFRVLERIRMLNQSWFYQAEKIRSLTEKYSVDYMGIDLTGPGSGVFEQVQQFYPNATPIHYTIESKTRLVLKAQEVIGQGRILWDASWSDIAAGFMQIHRTTTTHGRITYVADRSERTGHADSAWAIMHALINEGLNYRNMRPSTYAFGDAYEQAA
ncbi:terminase large subunit domain-containing protein [Bacterioplanoides sp.]|uniref:terminase large subunit domain-containing protein n=1 Tax=Bacterioplanoides sp. TaxID=2066072 RepID=UPI003B599D55